MSLTASGADQDGLIDASFTGIAKRRQASLLFRGAIQIRSLTENAQMIAFIAHLVKFCPRISCFLSDFPFIGALLMTTPMDDQSTSFADYVANTSEAAFNQLVHGYIDLVYSTALRLVNGDTHRAEDVVQMVFADLRAVGQNPAQRHHARRLAAPADFSCGHNHYAQ